MRYLPLTEADRGEMLAAIGAASIDELFRDVPRTAGSERPFDLPRHKGELEVERAIGAMAAKNTAAGSVPSFLGAGAYRHHVPAAVDHLIQRSEFLTRFHRSAAIESDDASRRPLAELLSSKPVLGICVTIHGRS